MITAFSLLPGIAAAVLAAGGRWTLALLAFFLNRLLDGLDGYIARSRGLQSDFGGYIDLLVDFLVYATIPIGVWWGTGANDPRPLIVLLASFYVNAASWMVLAAILEKRGATSPKTTSITMPTGLIEGTETVVFYTLFLLLPGWTSLLFLLMATGTTIGVVQRLVWAHHTL